MSHGDEGVHIPDNRPTAPDRLVAMNAEPSVMWPSADSGFEANTNSPAEMMQTEAAFARGLGRFRFGRVVVWLLLAAICVAALALPIIMAVAALLRRH